MTVRLKDFLDALHNCPPDGLVDFMFVEPGTNREIELHPQATLGAPDRSCFTLIFVEAGKP